MRLHTPAHSRKIYFYFDYHITLAESGGESTTVNAARTTDAQCSVHIVINLTRFFPSRHSFFYLTATKHMIIHDAPRLDGGRPD